MATDFAALYGAVQDMTKDTSSSSLTKFKTYVNRAYNDLWRRHPWAERVATGFLPMTADYATGTVTVTNASLTVTGSGTTFPSYSAATVKFALSVTGPWYGVATRDSATQLTLDRAYLDATAADQTYLVYQDVYLLASDCDSLLTMQVAVHKNGRGSMIPMTRARMDWSLPIGLGIPTHFWLHGRTSAGRWQVRVGPQVPDTDDYAIRYSYLKTITDLSADADEPLIPESRRDLIIQGALVWAYTRHGRMADAERAKAAFDQGIEIAWGTERASHPVVSTIRTFDQRNYGYPNISFPVSAP